MLLGLCDIAVTYACFYLHLVFLGVSAACVNHCLHFESLELCVFEVEWHCSNAILHIWITLSQGSFECSCFLNNILKILQKICILFKKKITLPTKILSSTSVLNLDNKSYILSTKSAY